mmetsp:Transcript_36965/g.59988  ORF Transcript_36965/g.59988 Transcript_36965/m.59988 type:complete len:279 (-) Transcript_36965:141-977(-)
MLVFMLIVAPNGLLPLFSGKRRRITIAFTRATCSSCGLLVFVSCCLWLLPVFSETASKCWWRVSFSVLSSSSSSSSVRVFVSHFRQQAVMMGRAPSNNNNNNNNNNFAASKKKRGTKLTAFAMPFVYRLRSTATPARVMREFRQKLGQSFPSRDDAAKWRLVLALRGNGGGSSGRRSSNSGTYFIPLHSSRESTKHVPILQSHPMITDGDCLGIVHVGDDAASENKLGGSSSGRERQFYHGLMRSRARREVGLVIRSSVVAADGATPGGEGDGEKTGS